MLELAEVATICHQANKAWCEMRGDYSQNNWDDADESIQQSAINGVKFAIANPTLDAKGLHQEWMNYKLEQGWVYGKFKDSNLKTHPSLVPFEELSIQEQVKDHLFLGITRALTNGI